MTYAAFTLALLIGAADAGTNKTQAPTEFFTRPQDPTAAPTPCVCQELGYFIVGGVCSRGCDLDEDGEDFDSLAECCESIGFEDGSLPDCPVDDDCGTLFPSPMPTFAPTECDCKELGYVVIDGVCSRGCSLDEAGEFDDVFECCESIGFEGEMLPGCPVDDECGSPFPTRSPVPESTPAPTPCDCEELDFVVIDGVCSRGCSVDEDGEFDDAEECCASIGFVDDDVLPACPVFDECPPPTPAPTPCDCEELDFVVVDGVCSRGCSVEEDGEFDSVEECCASIGFEGAMMLPGCPVFDECPVPDPCRTSTSTGKSGKSGGGYYYSGESGGRSSSGDMSMGFIDCFTSSSSKSGKSGSKGGKSGGPGRGHKGGKSRGKSGGGGHRGKGGKSGSKCGKSGGSCSSSGSSDGHGGHGYKDGYSGYGGGHDFSSSYSGKGGKSGHKGGKSGGSGHGHKGGKSGSKCGKSGGSCSSSSSSDSHYDGSSDSRSYAGGYGYGGGYHHDSHTSHSSSSSSSGKHGKSGKRRTQETRGLRRAHLR